MSNWLPIERRLSCGGTNGLTLHDTKNKCVCFSLSAFVRLFVFMYVRFSDVFACVRMCYAPLSLDMCMLVKWLLLCLCVCSCSCVCSSSRACVSYVRPSGPGLQPWPLRSGGGGGSSRRRQSQRCTACTHTRWSGTSGEASPWPGRMMRDKTYWPILFIHKLYLYSTTCRSIPSLEIGIELYATVQTPEQGS